MFIVGYLGLASVICLLVLVSRESLVAYGEAKSDLKWLDAIQERHMEGATTMMQRAEAIEPTTDANSESRKAIEMLTSASISIALNDVVSAATGEGLYL